MKNTQFKFSDLFAGIGGMRMAFESVGCECVYTSEIDPRARETYLLNFPHTENHIFNTDILNFSDQKIPEHEILLAGFPCQPYSIAGLRKGLKDERGGDVFEALLNFLELSQPQCFLLENVKGMLNHEKGETIRYMLKRLSGVGYSMASPTILNSVLHANVPQNRERVFIIGFLDQCKLAHFKFPPMVPLKKTIHSCLEVDKVDDNFYYNDRFGCYQDLKKEITSKDTLYQWRRKYVRENKSNACPTLTANMGSGGHNVPLLEDTFGIRKLTPRETANFQGFPQSFKLPKNMANSHLYHQFGNSVTVPLIKKIAKQILRVLNEK
jgi:DNA (cytosine-5)-methyltransferase 1